MKKEKVFLAPETVVVSDPRDTAWLRGLAKSPVAEHPLVNAAAEMVIAMLAGLALAWTAYGVEDGFKAIKVFLAPFFGP